MATTILRFAKIKSKANIRQAGAHQHRHHKNTPNADPRLSSMNRYFHGSSNLLSDVEKRLSILEKEPRSNSVLAVEGLLSLSPEIFKTGDRDADLKTLNNWYNESKKWLNEQFGDNLVNAVLHRDEQTPHIHFTFVPLIQRDDGKHSLSARDTLTKETLRDFQKSYYSAISDAVTGLEPPSHGSKRKHTEISEFYDLLDQVKSEVINAAQMHIETLKMDALDFMQDKYLPVIEQSIQKVEKELKGRLTDEVRKKLRAQFDAELQKEIGNAFAPTKELDQFISKINSNVNNAKVKISKDRTPDQRISFKI